MLKIEKCYTDEIFRENIAVYFFLLIDIQL